MFSHSQRPSMRVPNLMLTPLALIFVISWIAAAPVGAQPAVGTDMSRYYIHYRPLTAQSNPDSIFTRYPPMVDKALVDTTGQPVAGIIDDRIRLGMVGGPSRLAFYGPRQFPCRTDPLLVPRPVTASMVVLDHSEWRGPGPEMCNDDYFIGPPAVRWRFDDTVTFNEPLRRAANNGSQYDASPMVIVRNGVPWMTYHWGYRLGLVASTANWDDANLSKVPELATWPAEPVFPFIASFPNASDNFELVSLPPPWVEDEAVEYVNRADFPNQPGGQFFYAVLAADKTLLDSIANWQRTGKSFKSGGYVSVCRFYGGRNGGPNTHFYSADDKECAALKAIPQLSYEGQTFAVNMPMPAKNAAQAVPGALRDCPVDSKPLYRIYNNASASNGRFVSNHRYLTERVDVTAAVAQGWVDEGHVMCVPN